MLFSLPDFSETCESSSGSISVSRCQLFEAGFPADVLHLNDPSCKGTVRNGRVEFHFDNEEHICGTNLVVGCITYMLTKSICSQPCQKKSTANLYHLKSFWQLVISCSLTRDFSQINDLSKAILLYKEETCMFMQHKCIF